MLVCISLLYTGISYHFETGSLFMVIISACALLNQIVWALLRRFMPSQAPKVILTYCLIYEILTPLLLWNQMGQSALHGKDTTIYDELITVNFLLANLVQFNKFTFTLFLQVPCYLISSYFQAWAQCLIQAE